MADTTYYAWSKMDLGWEMDDKGARVKPNSIDAGEKVTPSKLGVSKEEFASLVESGAVRSIPYPNMPDTYQESPVQYLRDQAKVAAGIGMSLGGSYFGPDEAELLTTGALNYDEPDGTEDPNATVNK